MTSILQMVRIANVEYLGYSEIQLDFLEYYGGKETEKIQLVMKDSQGESVYIQMMYRPT